MPVMTLYILSGRAFPVHFTPVGAGSLLECMTFSSIGDAYCLAQLFQLRSISKNSYPQTYKRCFNDSGTQIPLCMWNASRTPLIKNQPVTKAARSKFCRTHRR